MRIFALMLVAATALCGCASHPAPVAGVPSAAAPGSPAAAPAAPAGSVAAKAKKQGFKPVTRNGQTLYCRTDYQTGSHLNTETVCLTEKESREIFEQTQRDLERNELQLRMSTPAGGK